jgi:dUTP pyrophosphatase|tara:strand:+ start:32878 stop:33315 length:438 start_codon:yes stop_codon:yes gene_type:complete
MVKIKIKKIHPDAIIPKYAHKGDSGMDVYSVEEFELKTLERKLVKTGLSFEIPVGYEIQTRPKSGLAIKYGITIVNAPGTIDSCYRGELGIILMNTDKENYSVKKGEKIAQIVLQKVEEIEFIKTENLNSTSRGENGFGSTGKKE